jgi:hypothetical protein
MNRRELDLLRSYKNGPRIWDAEALVPLVVSLKEQGLIEPLTAYPGNAFQLTKAGRKALMLEPEFGDLVVTVRLTDSTGGIRAADVQAAVEKALRKPEAGLFGMNLRVTAEREATGDTS